MLFKSSVQFCQSCNQIVALSKFWKENQNANLGKKLFFWHINKCYCFPMCVLCTFQGLGLCFLKVNWNSLNVQAPTPKPNPQTLVNVPYNVVTLALGSRPRQGLAKMRAKNEFKSHISCSQECERVRGNEPSHSQVNSHFGSWSPNGLPNFKGRLQGSKLIGLRRFFNHWKALGTQMFEMGLHHPFGHLKHKLWAKEKLKVKLTI